MLYSLSGTLAHTEDASFALYFTTDYCTQRHIDSLDDTVVHSMTMRFTRWQMTLRFTRWQMTPRFTRWHCDSLGDTAIHSMTLRFTWWHCDSLDDTAVHSVTQRFTRWRGAWRASAACRARYTAAGARRRAGRPRRPAVMQTTPSWEWAASTRSRRSSDFGALPDCVTCWCNMTCFN